MNKLHLRIFIWILNGLGLTVLAFGLYGVIFYSSEYLLRDIKSKTEIKEEKYILYTLAEEYENYLREKGKNLEIEKLKLINQKALVKNRNERKLIEEKLKQIDSEKRNIDTEQDKNEKQRKEMEKTLKSALESIDLGMEGIESLQQKNRELTMKVKSLEDTKQEFEKQNNEISMEKNKKINELIKENENLLGRFKNNDKIAGNFEWKKLLSVKPDAVYNDPVSYKGITVSTLKNRLIIVANKGQLLNPINVVEEDYNLTKPSINDDIIYLGSDKGWIFAYDFTGKLLWKKNAGKQKYGSSPAAGFGIVAVPSIDSGIIIYDKKGNYIGKIDVNIPIYSTPLLLDKGKKLIYATETGDIVAYDINNKMRIWSKNYNESLNERILHPLTGNDRIAVILRSSGKVIALNPKDGTPVWKTEYPEIQSTKINPRFVNGKVIFASNEGKSVVIIVNAYNGRIEVRSVLENERIKMNCAVDNSIYFVTESENVYSYLYNQ